MIHTPEPWNGNTHQGLGAKGKVLPKADYHRATDCVNACAGIEDPAKYIADLKQKADTYELLLASAKAAANHINTMIDTYGGSK